MHIGGTENRFSVPPPDPSIPGGSTPRERFAALLTELRAAEVARGDAQFWTPGSAARREIVDAVAEVAHAHGYRGEKPKKKDPPLTIEALKALIEERRGLPGASDDLNAAVEKVKGDLSAKWEPVEKVAAERVESLKDQLALLAPTVEILPGPEPLAVSRHRAAYSQGPSGDRRYARIRCQIDATWWSSKGVRCDVLDEEHGSAARAWVAGELDVEVLRRLHVPLREFVRLAWKLGGNPRVYLPGFPHGYEEREGLDFFGNDLRAQGKQTLADKDTEETRLLRACHEVVDAMRVVQVKPGEWSVYTRSPRDHPWGTALLLLGVVAFEWRGDAGEVRTRSVYDVGKPVAGPLRIDGKIVEESEES
jgi:hypothetical protein